MTPAPLMALVREWPHDGYIPSNKAFLSQPMEPQMQPSNPDFVHAANCKRCALEAALKAWAKQLEPIIRPPKGDWKRWVRERVLGVEKQ